MVLVCLCSARTALHFLIQTLGNKDKSIIVSRSKKDLEHYVGSWYPYLRQ